MHTSSKMNTARALRRNGKSLNYIADRLSISKGTVRLWVRDVLLLKSQQLALARSSKNAGRIAFTRAAKKRHLLHTKNIRTAKQKGVKDINSFSARDLHMLGLGLYWGEGYKKGNAELGFTNTDPKIITLYIRWLQKCFQVQRKNLTMRVSINKIYKNREQKIVLYWSRLIGVPRSQFTKTSFVKTKQKRHYSNSNTHYGTVRVKVRGGSVLRARILSSLLHIATRT